jgi:hypothetical protein
MANGQWLMADLSDEVPAKSEKEKARLGGIRTVEEPRHEDYQDHC